ncbi:Cellular morphogenesis-related protein [Mycena sanguinolenta]|uniref:Cellular morphogenesis-related protein n=1 Tax=Mycena sanguinolenta TaxID=230812 RepID=A0A8H6Y905_9AGAR|nr:Cellular morphogenesis-related protein [Mycena sanguinolenta]
MSNFSMHVIPPSSALLTAGPEYSPNSQELSRLTYYASNHPGKLAKLGSELEKRVKVETRKAQSGNIRTRASLLITLAIFRSLATECRRDIALFSPSLIASIGATMSAVPKDLEVVARAASVFTAWTTYTDGHLIGADSIMTREYIAVLTKFATLSCSEVADQEVRNRTRLIGFAALAGALNSEALYNDSVQFRAQVSVMMRPILVTVFETPIHALETQAEVVKDAPISPYLAEFRTRPTIERRAASIHVHIDGEAGPDISEVSSAALRSLFSLLEHANANQLGHIMRASLDTLDTPSKDRPKSKSWDQVEHCCWISKKTAEWAQYQYRYAIPTWLVERLVENPEVTPATPMQKTLAAMVTAVFNSSTPLVNVSTSDIVSNLINLVLRRASIHPDDVLLPALVECIASLGRHVYYSDQIQDLAGEIINRLVAIRCLLAGLLGLLHAAEEIQPTKQLDDPPKRNRSSSFKVSSPAAQIANPELTVHGASRRTHVPPDMWQDTLSLLIDVQYGVRADYATGLVFYLENEIPTMGDATDVDGVKRIRPFADAPFQHGTDVKLLLQTGDIGTKFLNAIHAYVYMLATSVTLGIGSSPSTSPVDTVTNGPTTSEPENTDGSEGQSQGHGNGGRRSISSQAPRARKVSVVQRMLERAPTHVSGSASASLSDYAHLLAILTTVHEQFPIRGLITGIPMLVALDRAITSSDTSEPGAVSRINAIKTVIARTWLTIAKIWECSDLVNLVNKALATIPPSGDLPSIPELAFGLQPPSEPVPVPTDAEPTLWDGVSSHTALLAVASCSAVHTATGLDTQAFLTRLSVDWTAEAALRDSVERATTFESTLRGDGVSPLLKISPALMHIENVSLQSLTRQTRGIGVTDLREALEGRSSMSNPALVKPPSLSTLDHAPSSIGADSRLMVPRSRTRSRRGPPSGPTEVRDVLNRLGIGKQNGSLLKSSFPKPGEKRTGL